jgi:hypothetical protein
MAVIPITDEIRAGAATLLARGKLHRSTRLKLAAIANGERKVVDPFWWRNLWGEGNGARLAKLEALADPKRNPNAHERAVAERKLKKAKESVAPGLEAFERDRAERIAERRRMLDEFARQAAARGYGAHAPPPPKPEATDSVSEARARANAARRATMDEVVRRSENVKTAARSETVKPEEARPEAARSETVKPEAAARSETVKQSGWAGHNSTRAAERAAARTGLKCQRCGAPLTAKRSHARYCSVNCRVGAFNESRKGAKR